MRNEESLYHQSDICHHWYFFRVNATSVYHFHCQHDGEFLVNDKYHHITQFLSIFYILIYFIFSSNSFIYKFILSIHFIHYISSFIHPFRAELRIVGPLSKGMFWCPPPLRHITDNWEYIPIYQRLGSWLLYKPPMCWGRISWYPPPSSPYQVRLKCMTRPQM